MIVFLTCLVIYCFDRRLTFEFGPDPFSDNKFLHVHRCSSDGKYIGSMGQGEGPQEFVSPLINRFSINRCIAHQHMMLCKEKTRGCLSIDSLIVGKRPFMSL